MEFLYHSATSATVAKRRSLCRCSEVYVHPCLITQLSWCGIMLMLQNVYGDPVSPVKCYVAGHCPLFLLWSEKHIICPILQGNYTYPRA
ncbi:unnamed protein product [Urochloa humidicola]